MESESKDRDDERTAQERKDDHVRTATDLSDRAAESVGRRYDGTKESVHEAHGQDQDDDSAENDSDA
ncbi:MAG TPA: hypothetical protein VE198_12115 [Actinoallomurus sp.]|jgi:hypothetical protein|nr:hypothetical protein [Actinoallomurus sp.]